ncbi:MAG: hypothetical protein ACK5HT_01755 [Draconibacterium sp.]
MKHIKLFIFFIIITQISNAQTFNIANFGAKNGNGSNATTAVQSAIDACSKNGGGTVVFPVGTWLTGTVFLKSNVSVYLPFGAVWQGLNDSTAYPFLETRIMSRENHYERKAMVYVYNLENIRIY